MSIVIAYDTETNGLPLFKERSEDPRQPHIVQLGVIAYDTVTRDWVDTLDLIVRPDGWTIPDEIARLHGITTERAMDEGIPEREVVERLLALWRPEGQPPFLRIAHNEQFDARIVRIAIARLFGMALADEWKDAPAQCTANLARPIMNLPPTEKMAAAGRRYSKTPNLTEAHEFFMGEAFEDAHTALADAKAVLNVWRAIQDHKAGHTTPEPAPASAREGAAVRFLE